MRKVIVIFIMVFVIFSIPLSVKGEIKEEYRDSMKQDILCLMLAYGDAVEDVIKDNKDNVYLVTVSGKKILYDDKLKKSSEEKFQNTDLQDMMEEIYPIETKKELMPLDKNPGRCRVYSLLSEVYGDNRSKIEGNLKSIGAVQFNCKNKAAEELRSALLEIQNLKKSNVYSSVYPLNGTYNYRVIAGTNKLSPHAYGIAIDLNRDKRDYWKWASREEGQKRLSIYPKEVVDIFQRHNFVWGGKWGHFDTLHFEYRPEIILKATYFGKEINRKKWYDGVNVNDFKVKKCIDKIDKAL